MPKNSLKILVITPLFYPEIGGSQKYMEEIYATMRDRHSDIEVDILCYNTQKFSEQQFYRGLNVYRVGGVSILPGQFALANPFELIKFLYQKRKDYDLIHCNTRFFDSSWWAPFLAKIIKRKIILTDHCAFHPVSGNPAVSLIARIIDLTIVKFCLNFFDQIFVTNKATQDFYKKVYQKTPKIIYGGTDLATFQKLPKKSKRLQVIFVGRMIESKGVLQLFEIAKKLTNIDFIFVGPGLLVERLQLIVNREQLGHIKILGGQTKAQVARLMGESDILVNPSFHHEGFPNVLTEAGASKLAVLATDVGGTREIVIDQKTGLLIAKNDPLALQEALNMLIEDKVLRDKLAQQLYNHVVKNFNWEKVSEELYKQIKDLLKY